MKTKEEIETGMADHIQKYGEWAADIPLPYVLWTRGNQQLPHTRLRRLLQAASDLSLKPLAACRVLDLGCLDGLFSIEFGLHGARVTGIEVREVHVKKAEFARAALGLDNVQFIRDDVRNISLEKYESYDVILCSGILYHLMTPDVFHLIETMYAMTNRLVIIDTHISLQPSVTAAHKGRIYHGHLFVEHAETDSPAVKEKRLNSSIDNAQSFWFTRPSLINLLSHTGFASVYECFNPPHLNYGRPGLECVDRCTFLAIKAPARALRASPLASQLQEDWPEGSLDYACRNKPA